MVKSQSLNGRFLEPFTSISGCHMRSTACWLMSRLVAVKAKGVSESGSYSGRTRSERLPESAGVAGYSRVLIGRVSFCQPFPVPFWDSISQGGTFQPGGPDVLESQYADSTTNLDSMETQHTEIGGAINRPPYRNMVVQTYSSKPSLSANSHLQTPFPGTRTHYTDILVHIEKSDNGERT